MSIDFRYVEGWGGKAWASDVTGVAVDGRDRVYVLRRDDPQVTVLDRDGKIIHSWGSDLISPRPHFITISSDRAIIADDGGHRILIFTLDGELLDTLGNGEPSETGYDATAGKSGEEALEAMTGGLPFNRPTKGVFHGDELFVSDGYRNSKVHRFSKQLLVKSWGGTGPEPGHFVIPHSLAIDHEGQVFVCDRENDRVQIFSAVGVLRGVWNNVQRPTDLAIDGNGDFYLTELPRGLGDLKSWRNGRAREYLSGRVTKRRTDGAVIGEIACTGIAFLAPHAVAVDSKGAVYVSEVPESFGKYNGTLLELDACLRKFEPA